MVARRVAVAVLLLGACAVPLADAQTVSTSELAYRIGRGSCRSPDGVVLNIRRMMPLAEVSAELEDDDGSVRRASVYGEVVRVERFDNERAVARDNSSDEATTLVDRFVDASADLDIRLTLAIFEGDLVVYWRETFENSGYRQGLLSIDGLRVVPLCEGGGGVVSIPHTTY